MQNGKDFNDRLKDLLEDKDLTQSEFAKRINVTESCVSNYIQGTRLPGFEIIKRMAKELNVSPQFLLGIDNDQKYKVLPIDNEIIKVPVFKTLTANDSIDNPSKELLIKYLNVAKSEYANYNKLFAKVVSTNHMEPRIMIGDIIMFETLNLGTDKINTGDICLVCKGNEEAVIREMAIKNDVYCFNLFNVKMPPRMYSNEDMRKEKVQILGRAVTLIHRFDKKFN